MRQIEEMTGHARDKTIQAGAWSAQLEGRVGMEMRKWATNVAVATRATLGGARQKHRVYVAREVGQEARSSKRRARKRPITRLALKANGKWKLLIRESVPYRFRPQCDNEGETQEEAQAVKKQCAKCPHNRIRSECWQCEGSSTCKHNRILWQCKQCGGWAAQASASTTEKRRRRFKQCSRRRSRFKQWACRASASTTEEEAAASNAAAQASASTKRMQAMGRSCKDCLQKVE